MTENSAPAAQEIDARIEQLADWRVRTLAGLRALIKATDPDVVEEIKWRKATNPGVPVSSHDGIICTGETYKSVVKLTFMKGVSLEEPQHLVALGTQHGAGADAGGAVDLGEADAAAAGDLAL
jgi:hypothetical protein